MQVAESRFNKVAPTAGPRRMASMPFSPHMIESDDPYCEARWFVVRRSEVLVWDGPEGPSIPTARANRRSRDTHATSSVRSKGSSATPSTSATTNRWPNRTDTAGFAAGALRQVDEVTWTAAGRAEQIVASGPDTSVLRPLWQRD